MKKLPILFLALSLNSAMAQSVPTLVADITTGAGGSNVKSITSLGSEIYFQAGLFYRYKPSAGVTQITGTAGIYSTLSDAGGYPGQFGVANSKLYFRGMFPISVGGGSGTYSIAEGGVPQAVDSATSTFDFVNTNSNQMALVGTKLYYQGWASGNRGICYVDATNHISLGVSFDFFELGNVYEFTACNNKVFFVADNSTLRELYMWDPATTAAPTKLVMPAGIVNPEPYSLWGGDNNVVYFTAKTYTEGRELFACSATTGVITKLTSLNSGSDGAFEIFWPMAIHRYVIKFGNAVYFSGCDGLHGFELMKYDIATATVSLVKDINASTASSNPYDFYIYGGKLYFGANNGTNGVELWVTNGTDAGTTMVADINPGSGSSDPSYFCENGGKIYFAADNGVSGTELFSYSGSGTSDVSTIGNNEISTTVFPNPVHDRATISMTLVAASETSIVLSDINGRHLFSTEFEKHPEGLSNSTIQMAKYPAGIYLYKVVSSDGMILTTGRIVHD